MDYSTYKQRLTESTLNPPSSKREVRARRHEKRILKFDYLSALIEEPLVKQAGELVGKISGRGISREMQNSTVLLLLAESYLAGINDKRGGMNFRELGIALGLGQRTIHCFYDKFRKLVSEGQVHTQLVEENHIYEGAIRLKDYLTKLYFSRLKN